MKKLNLQRFIEQHSDWENLLGEAPYHIKVSRETMFGRRLVMFKYSQFDSDFMNPLVRECRGLILDEDTFDIVSYAFDKFGNYGEPYCPEIDWKTARVGEKLDGSLCKFVKFQDGNLLVSTNGSIDAFNTNLQEQIGCPYSTFGELVVEAIRIEAERRNMPETDDKLAWLADMLESGYTYMFELTSPYNKIVVPQTEIRLNFLGCRNNETLEEIYFMDHPLAGVFRTPKVFPLGSLNDCIAAAKELTLDHEGYVVCDAAFNRIKVKSPLYISAHYMRSDDGSLSHRRAAELIKENQTDEFLTYFPEFKEEFSKMRTALDVYAAGIDSAFVALTALGLQTRKEQAAWILENAKDMSGCLFKMLDGKIASGHDWVYALTADKMADILKVVLP